MKTANRHLILAALLLSGISIHSVSVLADPAPPIMPPGPASPPSTPAPKMVPAVADVQTSEIKIPDLPKPISGDKKDAKNTSPSDTKVLDSVKDIIKRLDDKNEDITLDDLNTAREAIAKLDALIDIEKRLTDLDKIREERKKEGEKRLTDAIPMQALQPPPYYAMPAAPPTSSAPVTKKSEPKESTVMAAPPPPPPVDVDIVSIEGSNKHYGAIIKDGGNLRMVHAGDHLSDGSVVLSVTTQGVEMERNKITHLSQIKDVQDVFGSSP